MTITRGKIHKYLVMTIEYYLLGKVNISMIDYIGKMIYYITWKGNRNTGRTPSFWYFQIWDQTALNQRRPSTSFLAQILYLSERARSDIQTAVSFLLTRVREPDVDDCNNLARLMENIQGTIELPLTLSIDKYGNINGTLMHNLRCTRIWGVTLVNSWPWEPAGPMLNT